MLRHSVRVIVLVFLLPLFFLLNILPIGAGVPDDYGIVGEAVLIETDTVWHKDDNLSFGKPVYIVNGATLSIEAGAQVFLGNDDPDNGAGSLYILDGAVQAKGTPEEPIVITGRSDNSFIIELNNYPTGENLESRFEYVEIRKGGGLLGDGGSQTSFWKRWFSPSARAQALEGWGAIRYSAGKVTMDYVTFAENKFADIEILFTYDDPELPAGYLQVANSHFTRDSERSAVHVSYDDCDFEECNSIDFSFKNNWWGDVSGPSHATNPEGNGAPIIGNISFVPWLTAEPKSECTKGCFSNVLFLPGIESSRLYKADGSKENQLWEPNRSADVEKLYLDEDGQPIDESLYTREVIDELNVTAVLQKNIYKSFLNDLETWKSEEALINDYVALSYDWRLTLDDILRRGTKVGENIFYNHPISDPYVIWELRRLAANSKSGKVTIIAHSNGGLLAKALVNKLGPEATKLIDKIVLVAVPQTGTPQAIGALLHGYDQGLPFDSAPAILSPSQARVFAKNFAGAYHLLPTEAYFDGLGSTVADPVVSFEEGELTNSFRSAYGEDIKDIAELEKFLRDSEGKVPADSSDTERPSKLNGTLLSYGETVHKALDDNWNSRDIPIYQIAGIGEETLSGIKYRTGLKCVSHGRYGSCARFEPKIEYVPQLVLDGDGTVITPSALAMSESLSNVKRYWVNLFEYNDINLNREHANILEVAELRNFIKKNILTGTSTHLLDFISDSTPEFESTKRLRYFLHSPLALSAKDNLGNEVSAEVSTIPGSEYRRFGEVQYISLPADSKPILALTGLDNGSFTLEVEEIQGSSVTAKTTFVAIPAIASTEVTMAFGDGTIKNAGALQVDYNGNGTIDHFLNPALGSMVTLPEALPGSSAGPSSGAGENENDDDGDNDRDEKNNDDSSEKSSNSESSSVSGNETDLGEQLLAEAALIPSEQNVFLLKKEKEFQRDTHSGEDNESFPFAEHLSGILVPSLRARQLLTALIGVGRRLIMRG